LASEEDVADVIALYTDFFSCPGPSESVSLDSQRPALQFFAEPLGDTDPGIGVESTLPPETLSENLGFPGGLPLVFNSHRHRGGLSAWDHPELFETTEAAKNPQMEPIALHWHQLAGVHAVIRMLFTEKPAPGKCCGALVADEVGLGKTFQAATAIAFFSDLVIRQELRRTQLAPDPPIIRKLPAYVGVFSATDSVAEALPYLAEEKQLPSLPHLIMVPGTLLSQWEGELKTLFRPGYFQILTYGTGRATHEHFWSADGPYHGTKHKLSSNVIILASHSVCYASFSTVYLTLIY